MFNRVRCAALAALAALALAGCRQAEPVRPALWQVDGPGGQRAWLFGTIHALPRRVDWRSAKIDDALKASDRLVLEIADMGSGTKAAALFQRLGTSPGLPPLRERLPEQHRAAFDALLAESGADPAQFASTETWAAALTLSQLLLARSDSSAANGIEPELLRASAGRPVAEFEGLEPQLTLFDRLAEDDQRALLEAVVSTAADAPRETAALQAAWKQGDTAAIAALDHKGMLTDPELRAMLLVNRNRAWIFKLRAMLDSGARPFVAVGALHLAGPDGLAAQLEAQGYKVTRIQ